MSATWQSSVATVNESSITTFTVTMPGSVASGDLLIACISGGHDNPITAPAGWTRLVDDYVGFVGGAVFYRVSGGSEPGTYNWSFPNAQRGNAIVTRISGVDTSDPIDAWTASASNGNTTSPVCPTAIAFESNDLLVCGAVGGWGMGASFTPPGSVTERADTTNAAGGDQGSCMCMGTEVLSASGATGTRTWTCSAGLNQFNYTILIRASGATARNRGKYLSHVLTRKDTASTSAVLNMPTGVASGDLLLACIGGGQSQTFTPPAGWTLIQTNSQDRAVGAVYQRTAGASEPSTYTWTFGTSHPWTGVIIRCDGSAGTPAIDASGTNGNPGNTTSFVAPSVTTTLTNDTLFTFVVGGFEDSFFWPPSGVIKLGEINNTSGTLTGSGVGVGVEVVAASGATGTRTWACDSVQNVHYVAFSVALGGIAGGGSTRRRNATLLFAA